MRFSRIVVTWVLLLVWLAPLSGCGENEDSPYSWFLLMYQSVLLGAGDKAPEENLLPDNDQDGLTNDLELALGTDMNTPDSDGDGLLDGEEVYKHLTDPNRIDTDGDGATDGEEVAAGTNPNLAQSGVIENDDDIDGLSNDDETGIYGTNPNHWDTDGDRLSDYSEIKEYGTDPDNPDTDGDGVNDREDNCKKDINPDQSDTDGDGLGNFCDEDDDGDAIPDTWEIFYGLDPLDITDAGKDADEDGLTNKEEFLHTTEWETKDHVILELQDSSDPTDKDTDGDMIEDGADNCVTRSNADQSDVDLDGKGDACDADDDADQMPDAWETEYGLDPLNPADADANADTDGLSNLEEFLVRIFWGESTNPLWEDSDWDTVNDDLDNCPVDANEDQANSDGDEKGDVCDSDKDNDGLPNYWEDKYGFSDTTDDSAGDPDGDGLTNLEEFIRQTNPIVADTDADSFIDRLDNCPLLGNPQQVDQDEDGIGDVCDPDRDGDGVSNDQEYANGTNPDDLLTPFVPISALNDTGITFSATSSVNNAGCSGGLFNDMQDCAWGRDHNDKDGSDGYAGFSFTKLDNNGNALAIQDQDYDSSGSVATGEIWYCVEDNHTDLMWQVRQGARNGTSGDEGPYDADDKYSWYSTDSSNAGGMPGYTNVHANVCDGYILGNSLTHCNTQAYVERVNGAFLCGYNDWRLPSRTELASLVHYGETNPAIDADYFPNAGDDYYWTSSAYANDSDDVWTIDFTNGLILRKDKSSAFPLRLVRGVSDE